MAKIIKFPNCKPSIWEGSCLCLHCGHHWIAIVELNDEDQKTEYPTIHLTCPLCNKAMGFSRDRLEYFYLYYVISQARNEKEKKVRNYKKEGGEEE